MVERVSRVQHIQAEVAAATKLQAIDQALLQIAEAASDPNLTSEERMAIILEETRLRQHFMNNVNTWWVALFAFFFRSYREGIELSKAQFDALFLELAQNQSLKLDLPPDPDTKASPTPLANRGNTCFMNAALQAAFAAGILTGSISPSDDIRKALFGFALFELRQQQAEGKVDPQLLDRLRDLAYETGMVGSQRGQEDVNEFFGALIHAVGTKPFTFQKTDAYLYPQEVVDSRLPWEEKGEEASSMLLVKPQPIQSIEPGRELYDLSACIQVSYEQGRETTLRAEDAEGKKLLLPPGTLCQSTLSLLEAPAILPVQVSRYGADGLSRRNFTLEHPERVEIPLQTGGTAVYNLKAACVHQGSSLSGGHYFAYVRTLEGWVECNDSTIRLNSNALDDMGRNGVLFIYELEDVK